MPKLVIFDFDNTLEEFAPFEELVEREVFGEIASTYSLDPAALRAVFDEIKAAYANPRAIPTDYGRGAWFGETFRIFHLPEPVEPWVAKYWERLFSLVRVFPGVYDTLEHLREHYTLCILSDSDGDRHIKLQRIEHLGLTKYFDKIFTSDAVGHNKPHPRMFLQVLEHYHVAAEDCVMVGDNPRVDLATAKELGMHTVWQRQGVPKEQRSVTHEYIDAEVDSIVDLPATLAILVASPEAAVPRALPHYS